MAAQATGAKSAKLRSSEPSSSRSRSTPRSTTASPATSEARSGRCSPHRAALPAGALLASASRSRVGSSNRGRSRSRSKGGSSASRTSSGPDADLGVQHAAGSPAGGASRALHEAHVHAAVGAPEHPRLAHAHVGVGGHAHVRGHGQAHLADAQVDLERRVARRQVEVAQVDVQLAHAELVAGRAGRPSRLGGSGARRPRRRAPRPRRPRCRRTGPRSTAGRISQRTGRTNAPATIATPATISRTATTVAAADRRGDRRRRWRPRSRTG